MPFEIAPKLFKTSILLILRSKINKIEVLKNILWWRMPPKSIETTIA
jgi:hypothetical protein